MVREKQSVSDREKREREKCACKTKRDNANVHAGDVLWYESELVSKTERERGRE